MARGIKADSIHLALSGIVIVGVLVWGGYAVLFIQTYPSDQSGIVNAVLTGESSWSSNFPGNGTVIRPGSKAQFIMAFKTSIPANVGSSSFLLPDDKGTVFSPLFWAPPASNDSSFEIRYAVFTFSFCSKTGFCFYSFGLYGNAWLSGPQGNISQFLDINHYAGLESPGKVDTVIPEIGPAGNYTLNYYNPTSANVTGKVAMGPSLVVFSRSRPYLYAGVATLVTAAAFSTITVISWRKLRHKPENASSNSKQPTASSRPAEDYGGLK